MFDYEVKIMGVQLKKKVLNLKSDKKTLKMVKDEIILLKYNYYKHITNTI